MGLGFVDLEKAFDSTHGDGDGDATVDGSTRSGSDDGWGLVREDNSKSGGGKRSFGGVRGQDWNEAGQRAEAATVHSSTGPHRQEDGDEGCHEETPLCRRPGPGGEWNTGATGDTGGVERVVLPGMGWNSAYTYIRRKCYTYATREKSWTSSWRGRNWPSGTVSCTWEWLCVEIDGKTSKSTGKSECVESSWVCDGGPVDLKKTTKGQGHEHLCDNGIPVRNGNVGTDRNTNNKGWALQMCENNWVRKIARIKTADRRRMVGLREETGVQMSLKERLVREDRLHCAARTRRKDGGWQLDYRTERQSYMRRTGGEEVGQGWDGRTVLRETRRR